ncbi:structural cement protein Gp24 [Paenibacillus sp. S-38]|uniref:structural cement protein Gp24 n=1 Tax=Paenibacillus sp. S-38 TaxID=3416710 RepID=UPI003CF88367
MPITNYDQYMPEAIGKGRIAQYPEHRADTLGANGVIGWGRAVQHTATNKNRGEVYNGTSKVVGIAIANHYGEYRVTNLHNEITGQYENNDAASVLRKGVIWVQVLEDVVKGDLAVADNATGDFRPSTTATAGKSAVIGEFKSSATANGLAQLEVNLPNQ